MDNKEENKKISVEQCNMCSNSVIKKITGTEKVCSRKLFTEDTIYPIHMSEQEILNLFLMLKY